MARRFRLERMLRLRERLRQLRQNEAAALAAEVRRLERARTELTASREARARDEQRAAAAPVDAETFALGRLYDRALAESESRCDAAYAATTTALVAKREEITGARREERKLERVRDAHDRRSAEEAAREADRVLDELAVQGHRRTHGGDEEGD